MTVSFFSFVYAAMTAVCMFRDRGCGTLTYFCGLPNGCSLVCKLHEFMMASVSMSRWLDEESPNAIRSRCVGFGLKEPPQLFFDYIPTFRAASIVVIHPIILQVG